MTVKNLPKVSSPTYNLTVPSTKEKIKFRPFKVKEEKAFLMALEGKDVDVIINTMREVINACTFDSIDVGTLPNFDLEYIFLQLRAKSVNNIIEFEISGENDDEFKIPLKLDINDVKVVHHPDHKNTIMLSDDVGIVMRYPVFQDTNSYLNYDDERDVSWEIVKDCIDKIFDSNSVISGDELNDDELDEWLNENLDRNSLKQINNFFETMPKLRHEITYEDPTVEGDDKRKVFKIEGLESFFTLG